MSTPTTGLANTVDVWIGEGAESDVVCVEEGNEGNVFLRKELSLIKSLSVKE